MIIPIFYYLYGYVQYERLMRQKTQEENCVYESEGISIFIVYKEPIMNFGSGNKKMYLFSKNRFLLGECTFGEFPVKIEAIDKKKRNNFCNYKKQLLWLRQRLY